MNHFTGYINQQNTPVYPDIESMAQALAGFGVPMKDSFEGGQDSGLQQTATRAIAESVPILDEEGNLDEMLWSYAYYELGRC